MPIRLSSSQAAGILCWAGTAAALVVFYFLDPGRVAFLPTCPLHTLTGLYCPGCGSTRALHQLAHGQVARAFGLNPLVVTLLPVIGYLTLRREPGTIKPVWVWVLLGTIAVFGVLRNVPLRPFTLLAP